MRSIGKQIQDPQPVRGSEMEEVLSQFTSACGQRLSVQPEVSELAKRILENCGEIIETTLTSPSQARFLSCVYWRKQQLAVRTAIAEPATVCRLKTRRSPGFPAPYSLQRAW